MAGGGFEVAHLLQCGDVFRIGLGDDAKLFERARGFKQMRQRKARRDIAGLLGEDMPVLLDGARFIAGGGE